MRLRGTGRGGGGIGKLLLQLFDGLGTSVGGFDRQAVHQNGARFRIGHVGTSIVVVTDFKVRTAPRTVDNREVVHSERLLHGIVRLPVRCHAVPEFDLGLVAHGNLSVTRLDTGDGRGIHDHHRDADKLAIAHHVAIGLADRNVFPRLGIDHIARMAQRHRKVRIGSHGVRREHFFGRAIDAHPLQIRPTDFGASVNLDASSRRTHICHQIAGLGQAHAADFAAVGEVHHCPPWVVCIPANAAWNSVEFGSPS